MRQIPGAGRSRPKPHKRRQRLMTLRPGGGLADRQWRHIVGRSPPPV